MLCSLAEQLAAPRRRLLAGSMAAGEPVCTAECEPPDLLAVQFLPRTIPQATVDPFVASYWRVNRVCLWRDRGKSRNNRSLAHYLDSPSH